MTADVLVEDARWNAAGLPALANKAAQAVFAHLRLDPGTHEFSILACNDSRIAVLNEEFRGKGIATNVLSWPSTERNAAEPGARPEPPDDGELGDIAISYEICVREAEESGKSLADHTMHLIVHGLLHLLGYDHIHDKDAALMEGLEVEILGKLGIADPY